MLIKSESSPGSFSFFAGLLFHYHYFQQNNIDVICETYDVNSVFYSIRYFAQNNTKYNFLIYYSPQTSQPQLGKAIPTSNDKAKQVLHKTHHNQYSIMYKAQTQTLEKDHYNMNLKIFKLKHRFQEIKLTRETK